MLVSQQKVQQTLTKDLQNYWQFKKQTNFYNKKNVKKTTSKISYTLYLNISMVTDKQNSLN